MGEAVAHVATPRPRQSRLGLGQQLSLPCDERIGDGRIVRGAAPASNG